MVIGLVRRNIFLVNYFLIAYFIAATVVCAWFVYLHLKEDRQLKVSF
jgi:hypothetical protein